MILNGRVPTLMIFYSKCQKVHSVFRINCHVVCVKVTPIIMIRRAVYMRRMEDGNTITKAAKYIGYKSLREEQNLAVKGVLSGRDVFVTGSPRALEG